jgi:DNA-directed RNA polymerase specialized sigma24 family protein
MSANEITQWLQGLSKGDPTAIQIVWENYFEKLIRLARAKLDGLPRRVADEEDVALSALNSFFAGAAAGRYPQLNDRHDLWKVLFTITLHKALGQARYHRAQKRGKGKVRGESAFLDSSNHEEVAGLQQVLGNEPSPELAAMVAENCHKLFETLDDPSLRKVAALKMDGFTNGEIAVELRCTVRTVERKLSRIRARWKRAEQEDYE